MKFILRVLVLLVICLFIGYNTDLFFSSPSDTNEASEKVKQKNLSEEEQKANESTEPISDQNSLSALINQDVRQVVQKFGEPVRKDATPYGYEYYVYNQPNSSYMLVGVQDNKVQTIYALGQDLDVSPYKIGMSSEKVFTNANLQSEVSFHYEDNFYRFELSEDDLNVRPVADLGSGVYAQLNFDKFTSKLVSVRYMNKLSFIKMHPYELNYQGEIYQEEVTDETWRQIEQGADQEVLEITNVIRERYGANEVAKDAAVAKVAYSHSLDMAKNNYFDHNSPTEGALSDRLQKAGIKYTKAGENIAYNYMDAGAAVEGWLNSEGHRKNLLDKSFTYMGEGTYQKYYTQNFLTK
ncbi:CAP domain-containing protein [Listeria ilorinensis]|uniref:CAP domain-containing protein n=1 Tax=Listeria ilorinensis TaxID=2867439 RepID=UPI001EF4FEC3|nr:CAP domain-containing protein [Listeria ilorinensis]